MRKTVLFCALIISILLSGCHHKKLGQGNTAQNASKEQVELLQLYHEADSIYYKCGRVDTALFNEFINKATVFVNKHPEEQISPEMLYRAGIGSMILAKSATKRPEIAKNAKTALSIFNNYQKIYPDKDKAKYCYWQRAIIYDDILGDALSAEDEYRDFINRYPNDSLTPQFEQYIKLLGKSESEIDKELKIKE